MKIPIIEKIKRLPKQTEESLKDAFSVLLSVEDRHEADEYVKWIREEAKKIRSASMYELIRNTYFYAGQYNFDAFIEVLRLDDTTGKKNISNEERARIANNWKADLYLAIHHNASDIIFSGGGISAYIHSTNAKPGAAERQKAFYDACIKYTGLKGNRATPLAKKALYECGAPNCPSVLMELGFMDSTVDVPIILTDAYATKIAEAIAEVVIEKSGATKKKRTLYRVQVGAFSKEVYAEEMLKKLKAAGFEGYITTL